MLTSNKAIVLVTVAALLSSCSIFKNKRSVESVVEPDITAPLVHENNSNDIEIEEICDLTKVKNEVDSIPEKTKTRAKMAPFTDEESANVVITEFKNTVLFEDKEIILSDLADEFHYPADGHVTSKYGWRSGRMHTGTDIKANNGDNIYAAFDGVVRFAKYNGAYGNCIVIRHYDGFETLYAHASKLLVEVNQEVKGGDVIALAGKTGRATGYHLHFEVRFVGQHIDPALILDTENKTLLDKNLYVTVRSGRIFASNNDDFGAREAEIKEITSIKYHIVKSGDTLSRIAANNRTTVTALCKMNNISSTSILSIGQRIRVQ